MNDEANAYKPDMQASAYISTDPIPEYPPRLPPDTRRQVIIEDKQIAEIDLRDGTVARAYRYDKIMER